MAFGGVLALFPLHLLQWDLCQKALFWHFPCQRLGMAVVDFGEGSKVKQNSGESLLAPL